MFKRLLPINTQTAGIKKILFLARVRFVKTFTIAFYRVAVFLFCSGPFSYITMLYGAVE